MSAIYVTSLLIKNRIKDENEIIHKNSQTVYSSFFGWITYKGINCQEKTG